MLYIEFSLAFSLALAFVINTVCRRTSPVAVLYKASAKMHDNGLCRALTVALVSSSMFINAKHFYLPFLIMVYQAFTSTNPVALT
jgi:hypothetical protein